MIVYATIQSPVDGLLLVGQETPEGLRLTSVSMTGQRNAPAPQGDWRWAPEALAAPIGQLEAYFAGERTTFDLELAPRGTAFQHRVWRALDSLRYGTTITYGALAAQLGVPRDRVPALGAGDRPEPAADRPPVPPRHRRGRHDARLRRGSGAQAVASGARGCAATCIGRR